MLFALTFSVSAELSTKAAPDDKVFIPMRLMKVEVDNEVEHCYKADETYAVYHNGLWWAWLAPVAKEWGGLTPDASLIGDGWRNVASEAEWALRPDPSLFGRTKCAAQFFFPPAPWCDLGDPSYIDESHPNGYLTYYLDGSVAEFWVVRDDCGVEPSNDVPEFGLIGATLVIAGALGFLIFRRK